MKQTKMLKTRTLHILCVVVALVSGVIISFTTLYITTVTSSIPPKLTCLGPAVANYTCPNLPLVEEKGYPFSFVKIVYKYDFEDISTSTLYNDVSSKETVSYSNFLVDVGVWGSLSFVVLELLVISARKIKRHTDKSTKVQP